MSSHRLGAPAGTWIDRDRPFEFRFEGRAIAAFEGDSVASALLAAGVRTVARSFKLHRPRGIFACGPEEPNALLDVGDGARRTPDTRATDIAAAAGLVCRPGNAWPSLRWDLAALNARVASLLPAGFYYKTFFWPHWTRFEPIIRRMAGLGHAAESVDPDRYDEVSRQVDLLVIGGGGAGTAAALAAARIGTKVLLLDSAPRLAEQAALAAAGVECLRATTAIGLYDHRLCLAVQRLAEGAPGMAEGGIRERLLRLRARRIVLACGAFERPMLFPDNDRPGVMLAGAMVAYAERYGVACGRRVVVAAACDSAYAHAAALQTMGITVAAIVEHRAAAAGVPAPPGVPVHPASSIVAVEAIAQGFDGLRAVHIAPESGGALQHIEADAIASAGGFAPAVNLYAMAGGKLRWVDEAAMFVPATALDGITPVGACAGVFDPAAAAEHARAVGRGDRDGRSGSGPAAAPVGGLGRVPARTAPGVAALAALRRKPAKVFVDLQNDVSADDVALAARENYRSVEHLKRYTTLGMATDQGKTSNVNALVLMGGETGRAPAAVGTTKFRPPAVPVTLATLAGARRSERFKPLKPLPAREWHLARGALMEEFGAWQRPAAYPRAGESLAQAATREALQVRGSAGVFDASPLGKIEVFGPDAAEFLDHMYVGTMSTLAVGAARYGLLLDENGVIVDDGIVARLGAEHFWVNTTSGGADRVALAFEEWLQCEYTASRVLVTPVTSCWGNVTVSGPRAWAWLKAAGFDDTLAPTAMPHMTLRECTWRDQPLRVLRASFSGELGYEINLPALHTSALLEQLWSLAPAVEAVPYGIEALMILRTEKGYLHVGADTDGTTLPGDVGMDRGIEKKTAHFVGRRSLLRPAAGDADRLQLVGLVPVDRARALPVGAHIAASRPPAAIDGFVTSSCTSPMLGHAVALAMLRRGRQRLGERVQVWHRGAPVAAEVAPTPFYDPQGERVHGHA